MVKAEKANETKAPLELDFNKVKKATLLFRAINNTVRQRILQTIHRHERITVSEIYKKLRLEQSATSIHLAILRKADVVFTERSGQFVYYRINYKMVKNVHGFVEKYF